MQHTTELALNKRWKFVDFMQPILNDDNYSPEFKRIILSMFNDSMEKRLLPKIIFFGLWSKFITPEKYHSYETSFKDEILQSNNKYHEKYWNAVALLIEINFYNAPHWYFFAVVPFMFVVIVVSIFMKANRIINKTFLETLVFKEVRPRYQVV